MAAMLLQIHSKHCGIVWHSPNAINVGKTVERPHPTISLFSLAQWSRLCTLYLHAYLCSGFGYLDVSSFPMLLLPINAAFVEFNRQVFCSGCATEVSSQYWVNLSGVQLYWYLSVSFLTHFCCCDFQDCSPCYIYHIWPCLVYYLSELF